MAEASTTELTVTPKQLGKHLRLVRRQKGLSLSEVARGAGLSRRELVAYERGKLPIPESDLWVLAGSCGVDVAELMPSTTSQELALVSEPATSIGDTVAQLRKHQEDPGITPYMGTLHKLQALPPGKRIPVKDRELDAIAGALGGTAASIDQKLQEVLRVDADEATRLRLIILAPPGGRGKPKALAAADPTPPPAPASFTPLAEPAFPEPAFPEPVQPLPVAPAPFHDLPADAAVGQNVDVFEELARLPEPLPLGDPSAPVPDLLATPDPFAPVPLVGTPVSAPPESAVELVDAGPGASSAPTAFGLAADAPPIDVAMRQGSDLWDLGTPSAPTTEPAPELGSWDTRWQPPTPPGGEESTPTAFWEGTDNWTPAPDTMTTAEPTDAPIDAEPVEIVAAEPVVEPASDSPWVADWEPAPWTPDEPETGRGDLSPWTADEWPRELSDVGPWDHQPDPEAVSTGFYVDWGTDETQPATDGTTEPVADDTTEPATGWDPQPTWDTAPAWETTPTWEPAEPVATFDVEAVDDPAPVVDDEPDALPPISWRADGPPELPAPVPADLLETTETFDAPTTFAVEPEPAPVVDEFVTAGPDWQLGNALPLVEVRGQGALVMRRADERWALADVTTAPDFAVEVDVDFRSGPGLGLLFRATVDDEGRMSGYSFDIDPIYDGGGYLVRQWQADRELWNPIARVGAADPTSMYGPLTVRLVVTGDHLTALVNGVEVLTVENLKQASVDRGREAAAGDRVGVQAWSSSDLVIDTLRVAQV